MRKFIDEHRRRHHRNRSGPPDHHGKPGLRPPAEKWICVAEDQVGRRKKAASGPQFLPHFLQGHQVSLLLQWVAENERHPDPKECDGGVDYRAIYRVLADLLRGEVPPRPDQATAQRLLRLFVTLQAKVKEMGAKCRLEREHLLASCPGIRCPENADLSVIWGDDVAGHDEVVVVPQFPSFAGSVHANPLRLPARLMSKQGLERLSPDPAGITDVTSNPP